MGVCMRACVRVFGYACARAQTCVYVIMISFILLISYFSKKKEIPTCALVKSACVRACVRACARMSLSSGRITMLL